MSIEAIEKFRRCLAADPALQAQCLTAVQSGNLSGVLDLARARGCAFTLEEAAGTLEGAELSDFELEVVAGGVGHPGMAELLGK